MRRNLPGVALATLLLWPALGCEERPPPRSARFRGPQAAVSVNAITHRVPGAVRQYLAIANSRANELKLFDPSDDIPVPGPVILHALSIVTDTHPPFLAAAPLGDGGPDVLVAVSPGSPVLQLVSTWEDATDPSRTAGNRVVREIDLAAALGAPAQVLAMLGIPGLQTGQGRVLVALSGGLLVTVTFDRGVDNSVVEQAPVVQTLTGPGPVELVDLSLGPDGTRVYGASLDELAPGQWGVVELAIDAAPPYTWRPLSAGAPTTAVAAGMVGERAPGDPDSFLAPVLRVYAALAPEECGAKKRINCGVVTLDPAVVCPCVWPASNIVPDPVTASTGDFATDAMPFLAPMAVPGVVNDLVVGPLPANVPPCGEASCFCDVQDQTLCLARESGRAATGAVAAATSSNGLTYLLDLSRRQLPNRNSIVRGPDRTQVLAAVSLLPEGAPSALGLMPPVGGGTEVSADPGPMMERIKVTPGFTIADSWRISYQGAFPELADRRVVLRRSGADFDLAVQEAVPGAPGGWSARALLGDSELGLQVNDIVELHNVAGDLCPAGTEATIAAIKPVDPSGATYPGGAVSLTGPACLSGLPADGSFVTARATIRSAGLMLSGASFGYGGRPQLGVLYQLKYSQALDDPLDLSEAAVLSRKSRRFHMPAELPCTGRTPDVACEVLFLEDPESPGPVLAFTVGQTAADPLQRGTTIEFATLPGFNPMFRTPDLGSTLPTGVIAVDRSVFAGDLGLRFYVTYFGDDLLAEFSPGETIDEVLFFR
jgi:hypothetical protein